MATSKLSQSLSKAKKAISKKTRNKEMRTSKHADGGKPLGSTMLAKGGFLGFGRNLDWFDKLAELSENKNFGNSKEIFAAADKVTRGANGTKAQLEKFKEQIKRLINEPEDQGIRHIGHGILADIKSIEDRKVGYRFSYYSKGNSSNATKGIFDIFRQAYNYGSSSTEFAEGGKPNGSTGLFEEGGNVSKWIGGTACIDGCYTGKTGFKEMVQYSKKYPKNTYIVTDDNYFNIGNFWMKDGIFAKIDAIGNPSYDFDKHKVKLVGKDNVIYKFRKANKENYYADGGKPLGSTGVFAEGGELDSRSERQQHILDAFNSSVGRIVHDRKMGPDQKKEEYAEVKRTAKEIVESTGSEKKEYMELVDGLYYPAMVDFYNGIKDITPDEILKSKKFADGGKPLGSTMLADGGKPLGSTMLGDGGSAYVWDDEIAARDVELFAENDQQLYKSRWIPILKNLKKKKDKGTFDVKKAAVLMKYFVDDADKKYQAEVIDKRNAKEYFLSVNDRKMLAKKLAEDVVHMSNEDMTFEDGGKPNGSTGLFEDGGKPLGSTGVFADGGVPESRVREVLHHYKAAALWSSYDDEEDNLDNNYDSSDIAEPTARKMRDNVVKFLKDNEADIKESGLEDSQLGHTLWLAQNHHGSGFFDFSLDKDLEDRLTNAAHELGEMDLYIGDDGKIWGSGSESYADGGKPLGSTMLGKGGKPEGGDTNAATDAAFDNVDQMKAGGAMRIHNNEANQYSEHKLPFKGNILEGKLLDNGDYVVLSYGYYPIWYWNSRQSKWYGNKTKYSATTSKQLTQSRPDWNAEMVEHAALLEIMKQDEAHFDLGGLMVAPLYPIGNHALPTDNVIIAHGAGTGIPSSQQ